MSNNVFLDLGFSEEEAAGLKLKSYLFMSLQQAIKNSSLTQSQIAKIIRADHPKVSKIAKGNFNDFSIERISEYLQRLGYDIHVRTVLCPPDRKIGMILNDDGLAS